MRSTSFARRLLVLSLVLMAAFAAGPLVSSALTPTEIAVKNWSFTPATIDARVGMPMLLRFTSSEGVHGVESAELGLARTTITPGKPADVTFTPKTAGTFPVHCAIVCGEGHDKMLLTVKVTQ